MDRPDLVKILTGVRRCGKSTILAQFKKMLLDMGKDVLSMNLEDYSYLIESDRELYNYIVEHMKTPNDFILIDEVHSIEGWEKVVNTLRSRGANIYVTGSNAKVLSSDLSTIIAGRYVEMHILPFSFSEFLQRYPPKGDVRIEQRFDQFSTYGGMPIIDLDDDDRKNRQILEGVYSAIITRDICMRSNLKNATIVRLTNFMYANTGNITTMESLTSNAGLGDNRTADRYLDALTDSFIFYKADRYDLIGKKRLKISAKYYASDVGLRNISLKNTDNNASGILENIVFLELIRRGYDVVVGSYRDYEVDFTARIDDRVEYYQVAKTLSGDSTLAREKRPLKLLKDLGRKIILTLDRRLPDSDEGIEYVNVIDWLLSDKGKWIIE